MSSRDNFDNSSIYFKIIYFSLSLLKIKGSILISSNLLFPIQNSADGMIAQLSWFQQIRLSMKMVWSINEQTIYYFLIQKNILCND